MAKTSTKSVISLDDQIVLRYLDQFICNSGTIFISFGQLSKKAWTVSKEFLKVWTGFRPVIPTVWGLSVQTVHNIWRVYTCSSNYQTYTYVYIGALSADSLDILDTRGSIPWESKRRGCPKNWKNLGQCLDIVQKVWTHNDKRSEWYAKETRFNRIYIPRMYSIATSYW